jgi:hypothetical protein
MSEPRTLSTPSGPTGLGAVCALLEPFNRSDAPGSAIGINACIERSDHVDVIVQLPLHVAHEPEEIDHLMTRISE